MRGRVDLVADDIRVFLLDSTYVFAKDTHAYESDLTGKLPTGGGYTTTGVALANKTVTYDPATDTTTFDADDITITDSTLEWWDVFIVDVTPGVAASNPLILYNAGDSATISTGGDTVIEVNAAGLLGINAS